MNTPKTGKFSPKLKSCFSCKQHQSRLYRIRYDQTKRWDFVCDECWKKFSDGNPHYQYGGTWKGSTM
ncbi:MAG: hypothetical protein HY22_06385 [[Candidatus Thermochlorobacteriaceae] bacterium GBChlB]|nr:MAG: hypothetical protein HY22_06385 [[Candidatus Thermochlorobacteriaceae] bacterium GBChlB]